ncbi:hypothetical protein SLEP1_g60420, partial [Rubroshorea leprosula]
HVFCSSLSSSSPRCSAPRPPAPEKPPNYRHPFPAGNPAKLGGFLLLFLFLNPEIPPPCWKFQICAVFSPLSVGLCLCGFEFLGLFRREFPCRISSSLPPASSSPASSGSCRKILVSCRLFQVQFIHVIVALC